MSSFAKAEILKFAAFRQMLIAGRPTPHASSPARVAVRSEAVAASPAVSEHPIHEH